MTFAGLSLSGAQAADYSIIVPTQGATITPKAVTVSGLSVPTSKVYDGTTTGAVIDLAALGATEAPGSGDASDGRPYAGDAVGLAGTPTATYNNKDVTVADLVTFAGLSLSGAQAADYALVGLTQAATITPKALMLSGLSVHSSKVYDGTTAAAVGGSAALGTPETPGNGNDGDGRPYIGDEVGLIGTPTASYNSKDAATADVVTFAGLQCADRRPQAADYSIIVPTQGTPTTTTKALTVVSGLSRCPPARCMTARRPPRSSTWPRWGPPKRRAAAMPPIAGPTPATPWHSPAPRPRPTTARMSPRPTW